nr:D-alanyl-D-alanine carboxypeptidase family protein [Falsochrobactrum sp. TDYN1]
MKRTAQATLLLAVVTGCSTASTTVPAVAANDKYAAIVIDANTGKTMFAANADAKRYPASLTKMMTIYMVFEAMKAGRITKDTMFPVSAYAASRPPSKIGFRPGQRIRAEDAILAMITKSGNDVAAATGEYLGGSEERFAQMMTTKARRLGMRNTVFRNASGLPNSAQYTTARDMAILSIALRQHFPHKFSYFSRRSFVFRGKTIRGHNRLLGRVEGVDGIKTGYTNASGYNLASSVNHNGRRLVAVVMGGNTGASRDAHMTKLIRKYLPAATRGRISEPLVAMRSDVPQVIASIDLPTARNAPVPVARQLVAVEDVINSENGEGDADQPQLLALAAPTPRPAAMAAQAAIRPAPKAAVPTAPANEIDPVTTASAPVAGGWAIQVGSLPSEGQARKMLAKVSASAGNSLRSASPYTETFTKGSSTFYRARFVGFTSKQDAWDACASLKKKNYGCYAVAN